jgi:type IV pilus assembly protein PilA
MIKIQRNSRGFTLIELLIVIAIIGILAAIAIPAYTGYTKKSKVAGVVHALGGIKTSVAAYFTEKGNLDGLSLSFNPPTTDEISDQLGITVPQQYIKSLSVEGKSAAPYVNIVATIQNIGPDVDTKTLILSSENANLAEWKWSGTIPDAYKPKN